MSSPSNKHTEAVRLVIRLLPPGLTQDQFEAQITQYTTQWHLVNNYYYVAGAYPEKPYELPTYSRAYFVVPDADTATKVQAELRAKAFSDGESNGASVPIIGKALYENKEYAAVPRTILKERKKKKTIEQLAQFQRFVAFLDGKTESYSFKAPKKQKKPKAKNQNTDQKAKNKSSEKDKDTKETTKKPKKKSKKPKTPKDKDVSKEPNDPKIVEKKKKKKKPKAPQNAPGTAKQGNKAPQPNKDSVSGEQSGQQSNQNSHKGENDVKAPKINQKKKPKPPKKKPKGKPPASSPSNPQGPAGSQTQPTNATS